MPGFFVPPFESKFNRHSGTRHGAGQTLQIRPPGNRLEALKGNRRGQHSIRVNRQ
jgi:plasmid maintenance system killer protein